MSETTSGAQAASQMATAAPPPNSGGGGDAWEAAAQPAAAAPPATPASPASPAQPSQPTQPGAAAPGAAAPAAPAPVVLKSNKPGGLAGLMDGMLNVLTGTIKPETATGSDGNTYVKQTTLKHGEQWLRLGVEALRGAGAGWAAGRGRNPGAALAAGVDAGDQVAQQRQQAQTDAQTSADHQNALARQAKLDQFNFVKLQQENAARTFDLKTAAVKGTRDDIDFAQKQDALYKSEGFADMGVATDPGHLADTQKDNPNFWKDVYAGKIVRNKEYDEDGNVVGVHLWHTANTDLSQLAPKGAALTTWQPPMNPSDPNDKGKFVQTPTSGDYTKGALQAYAAKAESDRDAYVLKQATLAHTTAQTGAENATASEAPSVIGKNKAETANSYAEANKNNAQAAQAKAGVTNPDGTPNQRFEGLAQALYDGDILSADLKREAKGAGLDPNEVMGRAVEIGQAKGKPWSASIIEQEHKFAGSPKTQAALDGIDRIIGPPGQPGVGYMGQMLGAAQKAHMGTQGAFNSAGLSIKRFFGDTNAKNFQTSVSETRRSIAGLIGNPLLGGIESDKKLQQADEMLGEHPTLENLQGAATILTTALQTQRNSIIQNNRFLQRRYGSPQTGAPQAAAQPPGATGQAKGPDGRMHWADASGKDYGPVQP